MHVRVQQKSMSVFNENHLSTHILYIIYIISTIYYMGGSDGKESAYNVGDLGSIPGMGRSRGEGDGYPLHYSCLGNPMEGGDWRATVQGVAKSRTRLRVQHFHFHFIYYILCL